MNHAWLPWLRSLARHPAIVSAVAEVFCTKNIYLYPSQIFPREPGQSLLSDMGLDWHKDGETFQASRLAPVDRRHFVTAFVALSDCSQRNGCMVARPTRMNGSRMAVADNATEEEVYLEL